MVVDLASLAACYLKYMMRMGLPAAYLQKCPNQLALSAPYSHKYMELLINPAAMHSPTDIGGSAATSGHKHQPAQCVNVGALVGS